MGESVCLRTQVQITSTMSKLVLATDTSHDSVGSTETSGSQELTD